ncbi:hypothetical protein E1265_24840 [Streptomyces sp. 8K308]|uniref:hypothetical protein n=1 Tax=Streptomyces sp. 8K308 TaxID=2530388 RepID=UPI0010524D84|nr:hypothetical protein [Streptomyces sp. 8K308]TDC18791.1 hypothetical protein E1265_24840 [Streptomyces sp. 8K308]
MAALPRGKQGVASALNDLTRELGGVLGIAALGSAFNTVYRAEIEDATSDEAPRDSLAAALATAEQLGGPAGERLAGAARDAFASGMLGALLVGEAVVVVGGLAAAFLLPGRSAGAPN